MIRVTHDALPADPGHASVRGLQEVHVSVVAGLDALLPLDDGRVLGLLQLVDEAHVDAAAAGGDRVLFADARPVDLDRGSVAGLREGGGVGRGAGGVSRGLVGT